MEVVRKSVKIVKDLDRSSFYNEALDFTYSAFFCLFVLFRPSTEWTMATPIGELCAGMIPCIFLHSAPIFVSCPFVNKPSSSYPNVSVPSVFFFCFGDPNVV